jgi:hypothetical protein
LLPDLPAVEDEWEEPGNRVAHVLGEPLVDGSPLQNTPPRSPSPPHIPPNMVLAPEQLVVPPNEPIEGEEIQQPIAVPFSGPIARPKARCH